MKKNTKIILITLIIGVILLIAFIVIKNSLKETIVNEKDYLYEKVEQYLINQEQPHYFLETKDSKPNYNVSDFKVFTDIAKLGIRQCKDETYVYVWALVESYYIQDGKLIHNSGSSIPYKFILKNDEIITYEIPKDGSEYAKSIKKIFPIDIRNKLNNSLVNSNQLKRQVKEHYSYLQNNDYSNKIIINSNTNNYNNNMN